MDVKKIMHLRFMGSLSLMFLMSILDGCQDRTNNSTNICKMYHSDKGKYATVKIEALTPERAREISHLLHYYGDFDAQKLTDYNPENAYELYFTINVENKFGGAINSVFDLEFLCEINGIEKKLFDYRLVAASKRLSRYMSYSPSLENDDKVLLVAKPSFFFWDDVFPSLSSLPPLERVKKEEEMKQQLSDSNKISLLFDMIVEPGVEGFNDFTVSKRWHLRKDDKTEAYLTYTD